MNERDRNHVGRAQAAAGSRRQARRSSTSASRNEYQINRIAGSILIPLGEIPRRYAELDPDDELIVVQCKMGARSAKAADFLRSVGFTQVLNLKGGILDWIDKVDPDAAEILIIATSTVGFTGRVKC